MAGSLFTGLQQSNRSSVARHSQQLSQNIAFRRRPLKRIPAELEGAGVGKGGGCYITLLAQSRRYDFPVILDRKFVFLSEKGRGSSVDLC